MRIWSWKAGGGFPAIQIIHSGGNHVRKPGSVWPARYTTVFVFPRGLRVFVEWLGTSAASSKKPGDQRQGAVFCMARGRSRLDHCTRACAQAHGILNITASGRVCGLVSVCRSYE